MAQLRWNAPDTEETILSAGLDSLADGGNAISATVSNDAAGELDDWWTLDHSIAAQGAARASDARSEIYFLPTLDGTNFAFGSASLDPPMELHIWDFTWDAAATARTNVSKPILLPPFDGQFLLINETGQAYAASGNTLTARRHTRQSG